MAPLFATSYYLSNNSLLAAAATLLLPLTAILQGTLQIIYYRVRYGTAPHPKTPSHGVVITDPRDKEGDQNATAEAETKRQQSLLRHAQNQAPLRLLVIGDSLAIGVGQAHNATPIMPQVIASSLSKQLGGRVVYWTCHGAPGASTGWIVRELERGVHYLDQELQLQHDLAVETDDSSSDESDGYVIPGQLSSNNLDAQVPLYTPRKKRSTEEDWKERVAQHRRRFDPQVLGPYDIVVVLTGSNDLKSAFFPFLLKGEDAEMRRQAKARGGNYGHELRRLLSTLNERMHYEFQNFKDAVEEASESVRERVEDLVGLPHGGTRKSASANSTPKRPQHSPLIVLPGMPSRVLPIFESRPLRWLSVPIVDIMDKHKRNLADAHQGKVLFVPAASIRDVSTYVDQDSRYWHERAVEENLVSIQDISKRDARRRESDMQAYYREHGYSNAASPPHKTAFSIDGVHPNDLGYDFWGRYIASHICDEWKRQQAEEDEQ